MTNDPNYKTKRAIRPTGTRMYKSRGIFPTTVILNEREIVYKYRKGMFAWAIQRVELLSVIGVSIDIGYPASDMTIEYHGGQIDLIKFRSNDISDINSYISYSRHHLRNEHRNRIM